MSKEIKQATLIEIKRTFFGFTIGTEKPILLQDIENEPFVHRLIGHPNSVHGVDLIVEKENDGMANVAIHQMDRENGFKGYNLSSAKLQDQKNNARATLKIADFFTTIRVDIKRVEKVE